MSRIRTIKPKFFKHGGLFDAEKETGLPLRVAFAGLWTQCDREGRFAWEPRELKTDVLPYDEVDFSRVLDALATRGFIVRYTVSGRVYGLIPSWHQHQVINNRESPSTIPEPVENEQQSDASGARDSRVSELHVHAQGEGNGREGERNTLTGREAPNISRETNPPLTEEAEVFRFGKTVLGKASGGVIAKLKAHHGGDLPMLRRSLETAKAKESPMEYVQGILRQPAKDDWRTGAI